MRYLVVSDIHANLYALQAVLKDAKGEYDKTWFLGDVVGYGPHPNECIELLASLNCLGIAGNHDWATLGKLGTHHFNPEAQHVLLWTRAALTSTSTEFLQSLEISTVTEEHFTLVHGSPRHPIWEYVLHPSVAAANLDHFSTRYCLLGHTHSAVIYQEPPGRRRSCREINPAENHGVQPLPNSRLIINPGSVGQPRDGDPRASYAILDPDGMSFDYRRVQYPVLSTQEAMLERDFPARLIYRLVLGR
jgi:predicted phosphodiesterase